MPLWRRLSSSSCSWAPIFAIGDADHIVAETGAGAVYARSVHDDYLRVAAVHDGTYPVARGLWLVCDYGDLLADEPVRERRLADVRTAANGYHRVFSYLHGSISS